MKDDHVSSSGSSVVVVEVAVCSLAYLEWDNVDDGTYLEMRRALQIIFDHI